MSYRELALRYAILIVGIFILCFGIAVITKAGLGTSPISSIPYSLSLIIPRFTIGNFTVIFNITLVFFQWLMLRKKTGECMGRGTRRAITPAEILLQFVFAFFMGYGIDLSMFIISNLNPAGYALKLITMIIGGIIMALGVYIQLKANVAMSPGDSFSRAITAVLRKPYNLVRVSTDVSMVVTAGLLCIVFIHELSGVREGTIICALMTGNLVKLYGILLDGFFRRILG